MAALKYHEIKALYDELKDAGVTTATMPEWAGRMNAATKSDAFAAGVDDNWLKRTSYALDTGLEHFASSKDDAVMRALGTAPEGYNLPESAASLVEKAFSSAGASPELIAQAKEIGHGLPRTATNMLPMFIPGVGGLLGMAGLSGAETYTETGSPAAGLISGATAMAMPKVANVAEQALLKRAGGKLLEGPLADASGKVTEQFSRYFPETISQGVKSQVAGQIAAAGLGEVSKVATSIADPNQDYQFSPTETLLNMTLGQLPFAATYLTKHGKAGLGGVTTEHLIRNIETDLANSRRNIDLRNAKIALETKAPIEKIPTVDQPLEIDPKVAKEQSNLLAQLRGDQIRVKENPNLTDEQKVEQVNSLLRQETGLLRARESTPTSPATIFGDSIAPDGPREQVIGTQLKETANARAILVHDAPINPEGLRNKVVWYSKAYEPNPTKRSDGTTVFGLPDVQWRTVRSQDEWNSRYPKKGDGTPELPVQPTETTREQMFAHIADLQRVENDVGQANTTGDLHQAVTRLNSVQDEAGLPQTNDASLKKVAKQLQESGLNDPNEVAKAAVAVEAKKTARKITTRETERAVAPLTDEEAAHVSAIMGEGGFSVITPDKLSHTKEVAGDGTPETQPNRDLVGETAIRVSLSDDGKKAFNSWDRKGETTLNQEQQMFYHLTDEFGTIADVTPDEAAQVLSERMGMTEVEAKDEFKDFIKRPHVQVWSMQLENELQRMRTGNAAPQVAVPGLSAGKDWLFSMGPYDPMTNVLNGKHKLPRDGTLREASFRNMAGVGKPLTEAEMELYRTIVPEAFDGKGNVEVRKLWKGLQEKGPVVEVRKLSDATDPTSQRIGEIEHQLDTFSPNWQTLAEDNLLRGYPETEQVRIRALLDERRSLVRGAGSDQRGRYSFLGPKPESEMPGYVEGLVRVPAGGAAREKMLKTGEAAVKYRGPHFGSEDTNVLSFYRGYEETLPDGTKAFHVIEVQSDWGQARRDQKASTERFIQETGHAPAHERVQSDHPLLRVYESLALKAAIQHAKEIGATKVILSDAETAMMTEGHDKQQVDYPVIVNDKNIAIAKTYETRGLTNFQSLTREEMTNFPRSTISELAKGRQDLRGLDKEATEVLQKLGFEVSGPAKLPQEGGMRLHYDQTLPSAMEKLTGVKGEGVSLGLHKTTMHRGGISEFEPLQQGPNEWTVRDTTNGQVSSFPSQEAMDNFMYSERVKAEGSPVFRDASGQPKTQITGRVYDISNTPENFTLTDKARAPYVPQPEDAPKAAELGLNEGGEGLRKFLLKSQDPFYQALGKDLAKFGDSLSRVTAKLDNTEASAKANNLGNGQVELTFSPGILDAANADHYVAHELVHGLTLAELDNPTKKQFVDQLTELRQRLIDKLPKDMRKSYDEAVQSDWYNKYSRGEVGMESLHPDVSQGNVIYGLLNNHEMVAQGLTEPQMRVFMQGVAGKGETWFHRFTNIIKRLIGIGDHVPDSAFEEFLSKTDALLQHGEHVNDFRNYANRYFENLGMNQGLVDAQTRRALGLVMDSVHGTTPESMFATLQQSPIIRSTELIRASREMGKMVNEKGEDFQVFSSVMDELGHNVDMRGLNDFAYEALVNGENHDAIDLLPDSAAQYLFAQAKDMADVVGVLKAATSEKNNGLINLTDVKSLRLPVGEAMKKLDKILSVSKIHDLAVQQIQDLYSVTPDGYLDKMVSDPIRAPEWLQDADKTKGKVSWFKNFLQPTGQWAREDPRAGEIVAKGHQLAANSRKMASEGLKVFGLDADQLEKGGNVLSKDAVDKMERVLKSPKLVKAVNDWLFLNQKAGQANGETYIRPESDPEVAKVLGGLNQTERSQVHDLIAKHQISMQMMHAQQLEKMLQIASSDGAVLIGSDTGLKTTQNIQLAQTLLEASVVDRTNPLEVSAYMKSHGTDMDTQVALVQQRLQPEVFNRLLKYSLNEAEKHNAWKEFFGKNPAWASGQRYGKFLVEYKRGNRTFLAEVESRKEAEVLAEGGKITKFEANRKDEEDSPPNLGPDAIGMITRLRELEANRINMLKDKMTPDQIEQLQKTSPVEQLATEEAYRGGVPNLRPPVRGLTKGAEELPWLSNHFSWVQKTSSYWSRQLLRAQSRAYLLDPEVSTDREFQKRAETHVGNMLASDPELAAKFSKFTTTWFMGYNPASALINGTQSFVTHIAEFTNLTGKPIDSYRRVLSAMSELGGAKVGRKGFRGDEHEQLMSDAAKDGEIDYSMFDIDANAQESIATNYKRILNGQRTQTTGQYIGTAAGAYTKAGMWMFKGVEKLNNQIALLASFDYYREQGMDYNDAKAAAYEFNSSVNYGGGRAQRPVGAFSGRGSFARGAAITTTALQNYTLGTTFQLARYIQRGFFRPEGVTPAERYNAKIAATQMLATQLVAAGTLGLPFVSGAIALLDKAFPGLEVNKHVREWADSLFGSDKENGSVLTDIAMTGVPSMFGWDLQSRLSMGNTVPGVSEVNGFQPELLAGPPLNLIGNFVKGVSKLASGDLGGGVQSFLPSALKKPVQAIASGGVVKDYRDRPLFQPTVGESMGLALGFQPKRLSDYNMASRIAEQSQTVANRFVGQERQTLAEQVLKGEFGTVRQSLLTKAKEDKNYNPLEEVRAIARVAEDLTFPRDLRREGSKSVAPEREKLLRSFNLPPNQTSEVARLQFRWAIQQRLGLPSGSKAELVRAQVIDQLRQQSPNATRSELSRQADLMLRGVGRTLQEPVE